MQKFVYHQKSHCKYMIKLHFVFCTKYRKRILIGAFGEYIKELLTLKMYERGYQIDILEIDKDHIHILVDMDTSQSALGFVRLAKQISTFYAWRSGWKLILSKHYWSERTLWSDGYFVASTGQASTDTIRKYIEEQG